MNSQDIFFQLILFLAGAIIGVFSQILDTDKQKLRHLLAVLSSIFIVIALAWGMAAWLLINPGPASSTTTTVDLRHSCGITYSVEAGKPFAVRYGTWFARGMENATDNSNHTVVTLTIDGQIISGIKQPVQKVTSAWPGGFCNSPDLVEGYGFFYIANVEPLSVGSHSVHISYMITEQITDGYDDNGSLNLYDPGEFATFDLIINAIE